MKLTLRKSRKLVINITSLIDVLFLLLIFFMVSSTFVEKPGMELELPESESSTLKEIKDLILQIGVDEKIFVNGIEIDFDNLKDTLEKEHKLNTEAALILKADKDVKHGRIVNIMDIAKQVGIPRLIIATADKK